MENKSAQLPNGFFDRDIVALAKTISLIENRRDGYENVLSRLFPFSKNAYRIGFTGAPGSGKSTIVDGIAKQLAETGRQIGIIAVDPTSPFSGGALLGDRIRMKDIALFENVFIRSMATRGSLGGLAQATKDVMIALDAFGKEDLLIETVGVGQVELDIIDACDTVVVVLTPESGDSIQAMKAGLIEIADIFAVNKSDREGADRFIKELQSIIQIKEDGRLDLKDASELKWQTPIVSTVAVSDEGIEELQIQINKHRRFIMSNGVFEVHRKLQIKHKIREIIEQRIRQIVDEKFLRNMDIETIAHHVFEGKVDPYSAVREYFDKSSVEVI